MSFLAVLLVFVGIASSSDAVTVQPEQIAKTVFLNDTMFVTYNTSTQKCRIDCADAETMLDKNFRSFQKVWMFNHTEMFSADDKTFIDSNRSLEFQVLTLDDSGEYECCIRSTDLAYQSFVCYSTFLTVVDQMPDGENVTTVTEAPPSPSWNVVVQDGETLNAQPENNYFVKIFEDNVTDVHCLVNQVEINIKTSNSFPAPLFNDLFIGSFNLTDHSGLYECNGTMRVGNESLTETVSFTVSQSWNDNKMAELLDSKTVAAALKGAVAAVAGLSGLLLLLLLTLFIF